MQGLALCLLKAETCPTFSIRRMSTWLSFGRGTLELLFPSGGLLVRLCFHTRDLLQS